MLLPHKNITEKSKRIVTFSFAVKKSEAIAQSYLNLIVGELINFRIPRNMIQAEIGHKTGEIISDGKPTYGRIKVYDVEDSYTAKRIMAMMDKSIRDLAKYDLDGCKGEIMDKPLPQIVRPKTLNVKKMIRASAERKAKNMLRTNKFKQHR